MTSKYNRLGRFDPAGSWKIKAALKFQKMRASCDDGFLLAVSKLRRPTILSNLQSEGFP